MSKILITWVTGFVGFYLARRLLEEDFEVLWFV
jgi:nucleoside-diphosphate-sugar epimerase